MPVKYPEKNESRTATRRVAEALSQVTPITAALAHLYGYTHPSQFERDLEQFFRGVADAVNDHEERLAKFERMLAPRSTLSSLAFEIAFAILRDNSSGLPDGFWFARLHEEFSKIETARLEDAIAELKHAGLVLTTAAIGAAIARVRPTIHLFVALDGPATGRDTQADALRIASTWLERESTRNVFVLAKELQWEPRRLNPPLGALEHIFPQGRWSQEIHPMLATTSVLITPDERFVLRKMVESGRLDVGG